jgi:hypothetical protein
VAWDGTQFLAGGYGSNTLAYSYDIVNWTGIPDVFDGQCGAIAWNGSVWVAGGQGSNSLAYSDDGVIWTGLGKSVFDDGGDPYGGGYCFGLAWNGGVFVGIGGGTNSLAYSSDGISWTGLGKTIFSGNAFGIGFNGNMWVAAGTGINNSLAFSHDGSNWTGLGKPVFSEGLSVGWNGSVWVAGGQGGGVNTLAWSSDGSNWNGLGSNTFTSLTNAVVSRRVLPYLPTSPAKTFVIDHPKDESKYLVHACLEGPEAGVYYRGTGTIAELETSVEVELPDYVDALAADLTVQVTPIYNGAVRVLNASCVSNNKFTVYGDSGDFWWHVYGRRASVVVEPKKSSVSVLGTGPYRWIA